MEVKLESTGSNMNTVLIFYDDYYKSCIFPKLKVLAEESGHCVIFRGARRFFGNYILKYLLNNFWDMFKTS